MTDPLNQGPAGAPTNPNWSASPVFQVPEEASFLPLVTMTVTNKYGVSETRKLHHRTASTGRDTTTARRT